VRQQTTNWAGNGANEHQFLRRAPRPEDLPPDTLQRLAGALKKQWNRYCKQLQRCQRRFSEKAVHDSRVETRRLLAMLDLLRPFVPARCFRQARAALKRHLDTFSELRDTQVQLLTMERMSVAATAARPFVEYLRGRERRFTRKTRKNIKRIRTKRFSRLVASCRKEIKHWSREYPAETVNAKLLGAADKAFARTVQLQRQIVPARTQSIHCTRVAFKKFRYMLETLADGLPSVGEELLAAMHDYQTTMGGIQDATVLLQSIEEFIRKRQPGPRVANALRRGVLRRRERLVRAYLEASGQLLKFWPAPGRGRSRSTNQANPPQMDTNKRRLGKVNVNSAGIAL